MTYNKALLNKIHKPLMKAQGGGMIDGKPSVKSIMQMSDKRYTPSPAVMNTKAGLAAASIVSGPLSFIPGTASAVYDLGTATRYAIDGQWDNAKEDLISAGLNAIPTAGIYAALAGMGRLQKAARARAAIRTAKGAMNLKDLAGSSTIRNNITGLVQEFDKAGKEISSMRPRSAAEVKAYNQNLRGQFRTGATSEVPEHLRPQQFLDYNYGGMIIDPLGQWAHPGKNTRIPGSSITMQGVSYPVLARANNGMTVMMQPGQDYNFEGADYVDEYPMMKSGGYVVTRSNDRKGKTHKVTGPDGTVKYFGDSKLGQHPKDPERKAAFYARHKKNLAGNPYFRAFARATWEYGGSVDLEDYKEGGEMIRRADGSYSRRGLWDNIRANKGSGKEPTTEMIEQEKKINMKKYRNGGGTNNPGFEALPEYVQARILSNMGYGGYYNPMMAIGGSTFSGNAWYQDGGQYESVADYAKASGRGNSFADRKAIADQVGITNYKGTAAQNKALLDRLILSDSKNVMRPGQSELINPETGETEYLDTTYTESDSLRDLRLEGIRSSYDALQKRKTVLPQSKGKTTERVQGTTVPSRYVAAPGPFDYLNNPIMNYLKAPVTKKSSTPVRYEEPQTKQARVKLPEYDPYPFRNAGNSTRRQEMVDIESTPDVDVNSLQQLYRAANPGAFNADELSRRGRTSLNREGNSMYDADANMTGAEVMQRKMAAGAYGSEAAQNALRTNPNNPLGAFAQYMSGVAAEPFLGVGTGALKIATGRGDMGDAAMVGLAALPGGVKLASKAPAFARLMQMRTIGPMSKTMGNPMMEGVTLENIFSGANRYMPSVKKIAAQYKYDVNRLAQAAKTDKNVAKILQDAAQEEELLMSGVGASRKAFNPSRAAKNMNDLYERSGFKYGGIHINPANKGKFTASANAAGMGVQEFASHVLANKEDYSSTQVKRANFAHNAAGWNKADGGEIMDVTPEELEILRQQGYQFEIL